MLGSEILQKCARSMLGNALCGGVVLELQLLIGEHGPGVGLCPSVDLQSGADRRRWDSQGEEARIGESINLLDDILKFI
jgi:hypothetical protein